MNIYIVFLLLATSVSAVKTEYKISCDCIKDPMILDEKGKKSCTCYSPKYHKNEQFTYQDPEDKVDVDKFIVDSGKQTTVELHCSSSSGATYGYVVAEPIWRNDEGGSNMNCKMDVDATVSQVAVFNCHNPKNKNKHFVIDSYKCVDFGVMGYWQYINSLPTATTITLMTGTTISEETEEQEAWSKSVSATVNSGFQVGAGSGSVELSATMSQSYYRTDQTFFETTETSTTTTTIDGDDLGKAIWQWFYSTVDPWDQTIITKSDWTALTGSEGYKPLCLPGHIKGGTDSQHCCDGEEGWVPPVPNPLIEYSCSDFEEL